MRHLKRHQRQRCDVCAKEIEGGPAKLRKHENKHNCISCDAKVEIGHKHAKKECPICLKTSSKNCDHSQNKSRFIIAQLHNCTICNKILASSESLKRHKNIHEKIKAFKCTRCKKTFSQINGLNRHKLFCEDIKEVRCPLCPKLSRTFSEKEKHVKAVHLRERSFKCEKCPKAFTDQTPLKYHTRTTHGDDTNLFQCTHCDKKYTTKVNLEKHLSIVEKK